MQGFCDIDTSGGSVRAVRDVRSVSAVADNILIIKQKSTLPVSKTRQDKSLFRSLSDTYLPPVQPVAKRAAATTAACVPAASVTDAPPGVSLFRRFRCYLNSQPAPHGPLRHPPPPGVSLFRHLCCYLNSQPAPHGPLRHLHRVTQAPDPTLWQRTPGNRLPPAQHKSIAGGSLLPMRRPF